MRLYFSGQNLVVWTDYPGYDPEVRTYTKNPKNEVLILERIQEQKLTY